MPPSGGTPPQSDEGQNVPENAEPYYSNEDVAILHDIVVLAQELLPQLPERERLPTNALFNAYYDILPRLGIDADHDSRYARVLFKIGGLRGPGTLYTKFEEILARMGIEIEFGEEDDEDYDSTLEDSRRMDYRNATAGTTPPNDENEESKGHTRRNSESLAWDLGVQDTPMARYRRNSFDSAQKPKPAKPRVGVRPEFLQEIQPRQPSAPILQDGDTKTRGEEGQNTIGAWLSSRRDRPRRERERSVSTHGSLRIRRRSGSQGHERRRQEMDPSVQNSEDFSEVTAVTSRMDDTTTSTRSFQDVLINQPIHLASGGLMQIKAESILQHHLEYLAKRQLRIWRNKAMKLREHHLIIDKVAARYDKNVLLRLALLTWQKLYLERKYARETERFFGQMELRATRARNMFLMLKVLQHWSNMAQEQVERTSVARRHIIRTRCFNAWVEITAVNEFKVRRHVMKKFLNIWKQRHETVCNDRSTALQKYEGNLVEKTYWQWVRKRWELKTAARYTEVTKRKALFRWIVTYHDNWQDNRNAEEEKRNRLLGDTLHAWKNKTNLQIRQNEQAGDFYQSQVLRKSLLKWCRETQVIPARKLVQSDVKRRKLREAFDIWLHRTRQERKAATTDRARILQEAVTIWRQKLRLKVLLIKANERIRAEAYLKWRNNDLARTFNNTRKANFARGCLRTWMQKFQSSREERLQQEEKAQTYANNKMQNTALAHWYRQMQSCDEREKTAVTFYQPRLLQGLLSQWTEQAQHLQKLQKWSCDADYYFLAKKTLTCWKAATEASKRDKRKIVYGKVRRIVKINLAREVIQTWQRQARHILGLENQAHDVRQNKIIVIGMNVFDKWRARAEEVGELEALWRENVKKKHFTGWRNRTITYQGLNTEATLTYEENQQSRALKKWNLMAFHVKAQTNLSYDIKEKNSKRTFRKMFTYWRQKAAQKRPPKIRELEPPDLGGQLGITTGAEAWSDFGDGPENEEWAKSLDEAPMPAPIPGYLATPSKRSERVMARAAMFSTTPKAPLSTPFERHLRTQYSGGQLHSFQKRAPKRNLNGGGFADIQDTG